MKRRLITLLIFLLLGAIVNVAVAWGCAVFAGASYDEVLVVTSDESLLRPYFAIFEGVGSSTFHEYVVNGPGFCKRGAVSNDAPLQQTYGNIAYVAVSKMRTGWPLHSLSGQSDYVFDGSSPAQTISIHSIRIPSNWEQTLATNQLPVGIVWSGFVGDTMFHAAILWLLICGPFALRRRMRLKRGLCPACAYPVGTSDLCTECGGPLEVQR